MNLRNPKSSFVEKLPVPSGPWSLRFLSTREGDVSFHYSLPPEALPQKPIWGASPFPTCCMEEGGPLCSSHACHLSQPTVCFRVRSAQSQPCAPVPLPRLTLGSGLTPWDNSRFLPLPHHTVAAQALVRDSVASLDTHCPQSSFLKPS